MAVGNNCNLYSSELNAYQKLNYQTCESSPADLWTTFNHYKSKLKWNQDWQ